jgi:adenine-specific DNA-methyltransferase
MNSNAVARIEEIRTGTLGQLNAQTQQELGQYFTPIKAAEIMTSLFSPPQNQKVNILDPGAGTGVLSCALIHKLFRENPDLRIHVTAIEIDAALHQPLRESYEEIAHLSADKFSFEIIGQDFIVYALNEANSFDLIPNVVNPTRNQSMRAIAKMITIIQNTSS